MRKIKKYGVFIKGAFLNTFAYRITILGWMSGQIMMIVATCLLWNAIYNENANAFSGFTAIGLITYTIVSRLTSQILYSSNSFYQIAEDIREGLIANNLVRPLSYRTRMLFESIGGFLVNFFILTLPFLIIGYICLIIFGEVAIPNIWQIVFYIISAFFGLIIIDGLNFVTGQAAFYTGALFGLGEIKNSIFEFLSGALIPLALLPGWIGRIIQYLPFSSMVSTPVNILIGNMSFQTSLISILIQVGWIIIIEFIAFITYRHSVRRVVSFGG